MKSDLWIEEKVDDVTSKRFKVEKVLFSGQSEFQSVDIVQTSGHGKMLLNDGLVMLSERDEFAYHDMITHIPLFTHPHPKKVLVIGGGDGGSAREVLRHSSVEKCVMVEIDAMVIDSCIEHIPLTSKDLKGNDRLELIVGDGVEYMAKTKEKFDVIIIDSTDPIGPATPLFGEEFYKNVYSALTEDGIVVSQGESPFYNAEIQKSLITVLNKVFNDVYIYNFSNLTYPGGLWSFTFATKKYHPFKDFDHKRVENSGLDFEYYNEGVHHGAFLIPNFMKKNLKGLIKN